MTCSSCKKSKQISYPHSVVDPLPIPEPLPLPELLPLPIPLPLPEPIKIYIPTPISEQVTAPQSDTINLVPLIFKTEGSVPIINSPDPFISLAYSIPFLTSGANSYITTKSKQDITLEYSSTYFNIPYIDSAADNLENGNYQASSTTEDNQKITNYLIPYKTETGEKILSLTTIYDSISNYTFFSIPKELTYNSSNEASVALVPNRTNYVGRFNIPKSFYSPSNTNPKTLASLLNFYINIEPATQNGNISMLDSSVTQCACDTINNYRYCLNNPSNCCSTGSINCGCLNYPPCTA